MMCNQWRRKKDHRPDTGWVLCQLSSFASARHISIARSTGLCPGADTRGDGFDLSVVKVIGAIIAATIGRRRDGAIAEFDSVL
jgi:hypothetical protein